MSLFRAEKLIDLACSSTHEEEARTAALTACRLIRRHGFKLTEASSARSQRDPFARRAETRPEPARARPEPSPPRAKPPNGGSWQKAAKSGRCAGCGDDYAFADDVYAVADALWCARH